MTIFISNFPFATTEQELEAAFMSYGTVASVKIIFDAEGNSRGFGFLEMPFVKEALNAIDNLDGALMGGRSLDVSIARERVQR